MKLILRADVKKVTGKTRHCLGTVVQGHPVPVSPLGPFKWVGVSCEPGGVFLVYFDKDDRPVTDGWHESLEAAQRQAKFEFDISESDWVAIEEKDR